MLQKRPSAVAAGESQKGHHLEAAHAMRMPPFLEVPLKCTRPPIAHITANLATVPEMHQIVRSVRTSKCIDKSDPAKLFQRGVQSSNLLNQIERPAGEI